MKLRVCFLWHMHQPYYKDPETGSYILPWVRLHAIKDYAALPRIFRAHPGVRHTVNLVPSLLVQVKDYVENAADDLFLAVSRKNALDLSEEEERFLLQNFFSAYAPTMILPQPRYADLFRGHLKALNAVGRVKSGNGGYGASDYTDLVTLFNLVWFHPIFREEDPELSRLWRKGSGYTEKEKQYVLDHQIVVMGQVFEEYRRLSGEDGGELSSSPMYHPILPLLIDNRSALDALRDAKLPGLPFAYPADARLQLEKGRKVFRDLFGTDPNGLWPSEGSISPETLNIAAQLRFRWTATDEILLSRAFGKPVRRDTEGIPVEPEWFYRPYAASTPSGPIPVFFRDHRLSDLIGFEYSRWDTNDAANNFVHNIKKIHESLSNNGSVGEKGEFVIPVILDGENAWEYFFDSGVLFLNTLFSKLEALRPSIECVTLSDALKNPENITELPEIPTGSWIDGTFNIWIGHSEDHAAWEMLSRARSLWESRSRSVLKTATELPPNLQRAQECLLVAEGSDWCWWYGDDHFTPHGPEFDRLFRHNVKVAYKEIGEIPPDTLDLPIIKPERISTDKNRIDAPRTYFTPKVDGVISSYFEWNSASRILPNPEFGTMHRAGHILLYSFYYGFDEDDIFFRFDLDEVAIEASQSVKLEILFPEKNRKLSVRMEIPSGKASHSLEFLRNSNESGNTVIISNTGGNTIRVAFKNVLEIAVPFESIDCLEDSRLEFFLTLQTEGAFGERWPMFGTYSAELPGKDFRERMWDV